MRSALLSIGAAFCCVAAMASGTAMAGELSPPAGPSRADIERQIVEAEAGRGAGVTGIVFGALALVAGVVSLVNEVADETERDDRGYSCGPSSCQNDLDEEPDVTGFYIGFVSGAALIAVGTVSVVRNNRRLNRLRRLERVRVGYDPQAGMATVAFAF